MHSFIVKNVNKFVNNVLLSIVIFAYEKINKTLHATFGEKKYEICSIY